MSVDKFGRMSDTKTKDTGVSLTYINNNYVRSDGGTAITGSLDMRGNTIYNVADPVNPQDVVTKVYVDRGVGGKHLIAVHARYCGPLKKGEYQFKFSGANFENCEEIIGEYEDLKGSITGFVMPHSGHIKKIICESLLFRSLENVVKFFLNFISDNKKELLISDIPFLEKAGYVDIEDVLKKGIDELKKIIEEEEEETITMLETHDNAQFEFQIVKFEKSFNPGDYPTIGTPPKIISSVLLEAMKIKFLTFRKKMVGVGLISRYLNNDYITLSEGDVINIKSNYDFIERIPPFNKYNIKRIFDLKLDHFITAGLNFNFTFLIELDPL